MKSFQNWFFAALIALILLLPARSLAQFSTIEGDVKGEDGKPVVNAIVKIERVDVKANYQCKTNKKGHYVYAGLPMGGHFKIAVYIDGKMAGEGNEIGRLGADSAEVNFDLAAMKARAAGGGGTPEGEERPMTAAEKAAQAEAIKKREEILSKNKALNDSFNAGVEAMKAKNYEAAIDPLSKAAEIGPDQPAVWGQLGDAYSNLATSKPVNEQPALLAKAADAYGKAIQLKPDDAAYHNNYGLALAKSGKYPEAEAELGKAAEIDPGNAGRYYYNLGAILVNTGHNDEAAAAFKKALAADPNYADAHFQMGLYLLGKAQVGADGKITPVPGTVEELQKYLELKPNGPFADQAKSSITALGTTVQTEIKSPKKGNK